MRIFVIGNGPTMADIDLSRLDNEDTVAFNDIIPRLDEFTPTYWMFFDSRFYRPNMDKIQEMHKKGVKLISSSDLIKNSEVYAVTGYTSKLRQGIIKFYDKPLGNLSSVGAIGYAGLQVMWQKGYREFYVMGFDSREPRPKEHYIEEYCKNNRKVEPYSGLPNGIWGKAYDYANEWIWEHGGEIWDVSHSRCGSFPYKDLDEVLNG